MEGIQALPLQGNSRDLVPMLSLIASIHEKLRKVLEAEKEEETEEETEKEEA